MSDTQANHPSPWRARLAGGWIRPDALPPPGEERIDPQRPVLYLLEFDSLADRLALEQVTTRRDLPSPRRDLALGSTRMGSSMLALKPRRGLLSRPRQARLMRQLSRLIQAQREESVPTLQVIPVAVYWGRAPKREDSLIEQFYSENWEADGHLRKFATTLVHGRNTLLQFGEPLPLTELATLSGDASTLARKLARILRVHFRNRRNASLGPDLSHRRMLISHVVRAPGVRAEIERQVKAGDGSHSRLERKAERFANEIAADLSYTTVRVMRRLLNWLWTTLYDGVKVNGLHRLAASGETVEIVYVPCHRSHIDYLLLSWLLYEKGWSLPHIAAGVNLNIPIIGPVLRRGGAFFLRRSFAGQPLYAAVFNAYLREIVRRGHALEYFIEGGRTRTGRLLNAKPGMLSMTISAATDPAARPVVFVPIYFGYEKLLESRSYARELAGERKQAESLSSFFRSLKLLRSDYGQVHVNFGSPIPLNDFLDQRAANWREHPARPGEERPDWIAPAAEALGARILQGINSATAITPSSLLATTLLATARGRSGELELIEHIDLVQRLLSRSIQGSENVMGRHSPEEIIEHGIKLGFVRRHQDALGNRIDIEAGQQAALAWLRNNILHLLVLPSLIACCFTNQRYRLETEVHRMVAWVHPFLTREFYIADGSLENGYDDAIEALLQTNLLHRDGPYLVRATLGSHEATARLRLANMLMPSLERYYLTLAILQNVGKTRLDEKVLHEHCKAAAERLTATEGRNEQDLYDRNLLTRFLEELELLGYLHRDGGLRLHGITSETQEDAQSLLHEATRQAILSAADEALHIEPGSRTS